MTRTYKVRYGDKNSRLGKGWYAVLYTDFSTEQLGKIDKTKKEAVKDMKSLAKDMSRKDRIGLVEIEVYNKDNSLSKTHKYLDGEKVK